MSYQKQQRALRIARLNASFKDTENLLTKVHTKEQFEKSFVNDDFKVIPHNKIMEMLKVEVIEKSENNPDKATEIFNEHKSFFNALTKYLVVDGDNKSQYWVIKSEDYNNYVQEKSESLEKSEEVETEIEKGEKEEKPKTEKDTKEDTKEEDNKEEIQEGKEEDDKENEE